MGGTCAENGRTEATKKSGGYASGGEESERPTPYKMEGLCGQGSGGETERSELEDDRGGQSEWRKIVEWTE